MLELPPVLAKSQAMRDRAPNVRLIKNHIVVFFGRYRRSAIATEDNWEVPCPLGGRWQVAWNHIVSAIAVDGRPMRLIKKVHRAV